MNLIKILKQGENERIEFKAKVTNDFGEHICSLANAFGGYIFVGVDDSGEIVGVDNIGVVKQKITNFLASIVPPVKTRFHVLNINNKKVLVVEVEKSKRLVTIGGVAYIRIGTSKRPLSLNEILTMESELALVSIDSFPTEVGIKELRKDYVDVFLKKWNLEVLQNLKLIKKKGREYKLTFAGCLLLTENPQKYFPHTYLRIVKGEEWQRIAGPLWKMVEESEKSISSEIGKYSVVIGVKRRDIPLIPRELLREALVNALVHRNYAIHSEVFVEIRPGKVIIKNPGSFPPGIDPENPQPMPRNPVLYEMMFRAGYVEKRGSGIVMMRKLAKEHELRIKYDIKPNFTSLEISFGGFKLDEVEKEMLKILEKGEVSASELAKRVGLSKPSVIKRLRRLEMLELVESHGKGPATRWKKS